MSIAERTFDTPAPRDLEDVAVQLAARLAPGDRIALFGDLGAGKTAFVRGLARGLGHPEPRDVVSPTFAIHHRYEGGRIVLDHIDLYRLVEPVSFEREGLELVVTDRTTVLCCEWPERLGAPLEGLTVEVHIDFTRNGGRRMTLRAPPSSAARVLA